MVVKQARRLVQAGFIVGMVACQRGATLPNSTTAYRPHRRVITITAVPLLTRELESIYPFLKQDFAPGGVLAGKEVYTFVPSTVTVVAGDTLQLTLLNPEDDDHNFALPDLFVPMPGQSRVDTTYVAQRPGVYTFSCTIPAHLPMMWGTLVVLDPGQVGGSG